MLGRNSTQSNDVNIDRWIELHSEKLAFAYNKTKEEINRNADDRKKRHDTRKSQEMEIGNRVYVRNRGVKCRDKIQDKWKPEVYVIIDKPFHSVYTIKAENGDSRKRTEYRAEI